MKRESLVPYAFQLGIALAFLLVAVGGSVVGPWASTAQEMPEAPSDNIVPIPGATPLAARLHGQVPCDDVISSLNHSTRPLKGRAATVESGKAREDVVAMIAKNVGTTKLWVVQCMRAYGRRVPANLEDVEDEDAIEQFEEEEPEESAAEDLSEPGARERNPIADENSQDREELHAANPSKTPQQEKESVLRGRPDNPGNGYNRGYEGYEGYEAGYKGY